MYTPTTLQAPRGHMTRPQTYTIGHKVNSLLSELSLSTCETWLLPPTCVLCMIRYLEESHGATTSNGRASEDAKYKDQEKKLPESYSGRTTGQRRTSDAWTLSQPEEPVTTGPGHPSRPRKSGALHRTHAKLKRVSPDFRPEARTSGSSRDAGHPAPSPDIRTPPIQRAP